MALVFGGGQFVVTATTVFASGELSGVAEDLAHRQNSIEHKETLMAIIATFTPVSMTAAQYDDIIRRLAASGEGRPAGRLYHVCSGTGSSLGVVDVWDSAASFEAFGRTLMPILQQVGVDVGQPRVSEVHNLIPG